MTSKSKYVDKRILDKAVDCVKNKIIIIGTWCTPVSMQLGSKNCNQMLQIIQNATTSSLQNQQPVMYVEALWQLNLWKIWLHGIFNIFTFLALTMSVIFDSQSKDWIYVSIKLSLLMLTLEINQMREHGWKYFKNAWNILDLIGYFGTIYF